MSNRLDKDREAKLQPKRVQYAIEQIEKLGYPVYHRDNTKIMFVYADHIVTFYPYSGWHTGKSIKDGRGIENLLKQLKP